MPSINDPRKGYNATTGKVEEFSLRRRPDTSNADEWALWLEQHADYGIEFKAVQIAEALDSMHRGAFNAGLRAAPPNKQAAEDAALPEADRPTPPSSPEELVRALEEMSAAMAEDDGLWFVAQTAAEAYLQQALRKLCAAIEGVSSEECAHTALSNYRKG